MYECISSRYCTASLKKCTYSETLLIRHLYNPTFSLIRPIYEVRTVTIHKYGKRHSIIQHYSQVPFECRIREVSLYVCTYTYMCVWCTYVRTYAHTYVRTYIRTNILKHTYEILFIINLEFSGVE